MSQKTFSDKMFVCSRLSVLCWLVFYLILLALTKDSADAQEIRKFAFIDFLTYIKYFNFNVLLNLNQELYVFLTINNKVIRLNKILQLIYLVENIL